MSPSQHKPTQIIDLLVELCDLKTIHSSMNNYPWISVPSRLRINHLPMRSYMPHLKLRCVNG